MAEDISKLPRWAQHRISKLEADIIDYDAQMQKFCGAESSRVEVNPYRIYEEGRSRLFLPEKLRIRFHFGQGRYIDVWLSDDGIEIQSGGNLAVIPGSSNSVTVKLVDG